MKIEDMVYEVAREALEFEKVRQYILDSCLGPGGRKASAEIQISIDIDVIRKNLSETNEFLEAQRMDEPIPLSSYESIEDEISRLSVSGYVLSEESVLRVVLTFDAITRIKKYFSNARSVARYPLTSARVNDLHNPDDWRKFIRAILDEEGNVKPNASPELASIQKSINRRRLDLDREFNKVLAGYRGKGWLSENGESVRNGRRVLSILSENKRKVGGITHDESATGRTTFIEPATVVQINNVITELQIGFKKEVYRLMASICEMLHPFSEEIGQMYRALSEIDFIRAKAMFAMRVNGICPKVDPEPKLQVREARHPLLFLQNKSLRKPTISFDLVLNQPNRLLLLSGPNAGGKSILMKAVGLIQLMVQAGIPVPVAAKSEFGVFHKFFVDIGDQQSIENELSTYSSRLRNMKSIVDQADEKSLLLIDEFGSGTDPKLGAAIAESLLKDFNEKKSVGVITTHYSNLKVFAFETKGIVNGAMIFNKEEMKPTYQLKIGRPGSSFTFEIASQAGLPPDIIKYARRRSGKAHQAMEDLLIDLESQRVNLQQTLDQAITKEKRLDQLIKSYEQLSANLDLHKKKFKLAQKEVDFQKVADQNKEMERLVKEIRESKNAEKAVAALSKIKAKKSKLKAEIEIISEDVHAEIRKDFDVKTLGPGSFVRLIDGQTVGEVISIEKNTAYVIFGGMQVEVKLKDLMKAEEPIQTNRAGSIQTEIRKEDRFDSKLDIRGMRHEDAAQTVEKFLDAAFLSNTLHVHIIHGKGSGVLKKLVKNKLREYDVSRVYHPPAERGGDGVTMIEL